MTKRPARPIQYCIPTEITVTPFKHKMSKARWSLTMKHNGEHLFLGGVVDTMVEVMKRINQQFARSRYSDEQVFKELDRSVGCVLTNEWAYRLADDGKVFVARDDKHEWHHADEVEFVRWYLNQKKEN